MTIIEQLFLALVLAAFVSFFVLLVTLSWLDGRYERRIASPKQAAAPKLAPPPAGAQRAF